MKTAEEQDIEAIENEICKVEKEIPAFLQKKIEIKLLIILPN